MGEVRDIQTGVNLGKQTNQQTNQQISQWPHGQFARDVAEKAARRGISVEGIDERSSTKTCRVRGHVRSSSPRGRRLRCAGCGARIHRDVNGSANSCSKGRMAAMPWCRPLPSSSSVPSDERPRHGPQVARAEREPPGFRRGSVRYRHSAVRSRR
jgi:transposase